jgi:hypothetical protein
MSSSDPFNATVLGALLPIVTTTLFSIVSVPRVSNNVVLSARIELVYIFIPEANLEPEYEKA